MRELPKIVKDAQRVRAMIHEAFTHMARRHKYTIGQRATDAAFDVVFTALQVWRAPAVRKAEQMEALTRAVDTLKLHLQLAKDVNSFRSWKEFEAIIRLVDEVGRQSGGWLKRATNTGQDAGAAKPRRQRAQTLSSRPASMGASQ